MKKAAFVIAVGVWLLLIGGCQAGSFKPTSSIFSSPLTPTSLTLPQPLPGKTTIVGRVVTHSGSPLANMPVHLARVYRQAGAGIFVLDSFSPSGLTDADGYFVIESVDPGEYVIVVGNPEGEYEIVSVSPGEPKVWNFLADKATDIGVLKVALGKR